MNRNVLVLKEHRHVKFGRRGVPTLAGTSWASGVYKYKYHARAALMRC